MALLLRCLSSISSSFLLGPATVSILDLTHSVTWFCYGYGVYSYSQSHASGLTNIWFCCGVWSRSLWYGVYSQSHAYGFTINLVLLQHLYRCHAFGYLVSATATVSILNFTPWIYRFCHGIYSKSHASGYLVYLFTVSISRLYLLGSAMATATVSTLNLKQMAMAAWFRYNVHSQSPLIMLPTIWTVNSFGHSQFNWSSVVLRCWWY
mmetsp:Transcript_26969/g.53854  ORF Transcript_26969/g.53854 Transcript_26969/m.53854 type:complete len:207 (-) Transcript_26969:897-1517(-)